MGAVTEASNLQKRTKEDLCLLCSINKADKTESHIIPKFITKKLKEETGENKFHVLRTAHPLQNNETAQDSDKEDHILCTDCEKFFEILETSMGRIINHKEWLMEKPSFFNIIKGSKITIKKYNSVHHQLAFLFIASIAFRCSISREGITTEHFKLLPAYEDQLKNLLAEFRGISKASIIEKLSETHIKHIDIEYCISTFNPNEVQDYLGRFILCDSISASLYVFKLDNFIMILKFKGSIPGKLKTSIEQNNWSKDFRIKLFSPNEWTHINRQYFLKLTQSANNHLPGQ